MYFIYYITLLIYQNYLGFLFLSCNSFSSETFFSSQVSEHISSKFFSQDRLREELSLVILLLLELLHSPVTTTV